MLKWLRLIAHTNNAVLDYLDTTGTDYREELRALLDNDCSSEDLYDLMAKCGAEKPDLETGNENHVGGPLISLEDM